MGGARIPVGGYAPRGPPGASSRCAKSRARRGAGSQSYPPRLCSDFAVRSEANEHACRVRPHFSLQSAFLSNDYWISG